MQPTDKQISYAKKLGIENPEQYTKIELSRKIDERTGSSPKKATGAPQSQITGQHDIIIQRTEKPHSFEFGKASNRHKIYYADIQELKELYQQLKDSGFIELQDEVEHIKM